MKTYMSLKTLSLGALSCVLISPGAIPAGPVTAQPTVYVANPSESPVPVQVVKDVTVDARQLFTAETYVVFKDYEHKGSANFAFKKLFDTFDIPLGKRLVVETLSCSGMAPIAAQGIRCGISVYDESTTDETQFEMLLPTQVVDENRVFADMHDVRINAGEATVPVAIASFEPVASADPVTFTVAISISGYLEDAR
jgi:hypothetical protein